MAQLTFAYTALDSAGARRTGAVEAETRDAAVARLASEGRFVLEINESTRKAAQTEAGSVNRRQPSRQDLALFTRRMADLSSAGLPLDRVLQVVAEQSENAVLRQVSEDALVEVRSGTPVSQALAKHSRYFNQVFTQTLRAGEASGQFGEVATRLADYQEMEVTRRGQVSSALVYPSVLACTAVGVVVFLITFVIPRMADTFADMGNSLPLSTKMLLAGSDFVTRNWPAIVMTIVSVGVGLRLWFATDGGQEARDRMLISMPVVGTVLMKATVSRFARVLGTLVYGGVPILDALDIAGLSASNRVFLKSARAVEEEVRAGRPIADAMRDAGAFPPVLTHMVAVGEETGDLPKMLGRVADSLDFEVDTGMRRLVALVEPIIVLTMGTFVGFVVLSVMLPIYQSQDLVK
ncbi:MAG: type II secretion system F family protein [Capsulimonadaceae bacterium]